MCTFLSLSFSLSMFFLGKYWSTRTKGYTRDARTACKFHVQIAYLTYSYGYNWYLVFQFSFYVVYVVAFFYGENYATATVFEIPFWIYKVYSGCAFLPFGLGYFIFWIQALHPSLRSFFSRSYLKNGDSTEVERVEMLLFYNNSSHSCKVQTVICQPTNLLFSCQSVESCTVQQHIMIVFNPLCLREKKSIDWGYKICEAVADGFLMRQIKALGSSLLINPLHSGKSY